jgi:hypothetical protein
MPDHVHALISSIADRDASIGAFTKWFKRWFNEAYWNCGPAVSDGHRPRWPWQEGCFDRLLRSDESLSDKWEYIRPNPVRTGLVSDPDEWPYQYQFNNDDLVNKLLAVSVRRRWLDRRLPQTVYNLAYNSGLLFHQPFEIVQILIDPI